MRMGILSARFQRVTLLSAPLNVKSWKVRSFEEQIQVREHVCKSVCDQLSAAHDEDLQHAF